MSGNERVTEQGVAGRIPARRATCTTRQISVAAGDLAHFHGCACVR
jgi:hypothetical protein